MSQNIKRSRRIADLLRHELANAIKKGVNDPRLTGLSITSVDVSPDLRNAKVYYTLMDKTLCKDAQLALQKATGFLRHILSQNMELRYTPILKFIYDEVTEKAIEISALINRAVADDELRQTEDKGDEGPTKQ